MWYFPWTAIYDQGMGPRVGDWQIRTPISWDVTLASQGFAGRDKEEDGLSLLLSTSNLLSNNTDFLI